MLQLCFITKKEDGEERVIPLSAASIRFTPGEKSCLDQIRWRKGEVILGRIGEPSRWSRAINPGQAPWTLGEHMNPNEVFSALCNYLMQAYDLDANYIERLLRTWRIENRDVSDDAPGAAMG